MGEAAACAAKGAGATGGGGEIGEVVVCDRRRGEGGMRLGAKEKVEGV